MLGPTIDMVWVGKLGSAAVAGVGAAGIAVQLTVTSTMGLSLGLRALIARFIGARDMPGANHAAQQGLLLSAGFGLFVALVGVFFAEPILNLLGLHPDVVREGAAYLRVMFIGMGAMSFRVMTEGVMQASGDTVSPMKISVLILMWAEGIVCIFNAEPEVVEVGGKFMRIAVAGFAVMGFVAVGMQSLAGAGDTLPTMIISLITMWGVTLPLAYLLPRVTDMGVYGIRWAMSAGMVFGAIVFTAISVWGGGSGGKCKSRVSIRN
jgi:Na+-driven multidrug efflux pump